MGGGPWGNVGAGVATGVRDCSFRSRNSALGLIIVIFTRPVYCALWPHSSVVVKPNKDGRVRILQSPCPCLTELRQGAVRKREREKKSKRK